MHLSQIMMYVKWKPLWEIWLDYAYMSHWIYDIHCILAYPVIDEGLSIPISPNDLQKIKWLWKLEVKLSHSFDYFHWNFLHIIYLYKWEGVTFGVSQFNLLFSKLSFIQVTHYGKKCHRNGTFGCCGFQWSGTAWLVPTKCDNLLSVEYLTWHSYQDNRFLMLPNVARKYSNLNPLSSLKLKT